ncbi:VOC family protein [Paenibacillus pasadenensis]|uniref:VOC family protein n=1 Tax=Paenibacillus pasadenensis TaxID=217090 RepID=UPI00203E5283|nr:VOC family protein [Paenibacillus pasadenensis]MCM3747805.1 VOC family protein [Paenibacillus pasadenensis]
MNVQTCFWFDTQAEEAVDFYRTLIPGAKVLHVSRYGEGGPAPAGTVKLIQFELGGQTYQALNGGPHYQLTPAASISVSCDSQEQVDELWARLTEGGEESRCGWLTDRFGLSWQIIPPGLERLLDAEDRIKAGRAVAALLTMRKLDIHELQRAFDGI